MEDFDLIEILGLSIGPWTIKSDGIHHTSNKNFYIPNEELTLTEGNHRDAPWMWPMHFHRYELSLDDMRGLLSCCAIQRNRNGYENDQYIDDITWTKILEEREPDGLEGLGPECDT